MLEVKPKKMIHYTEMVPLRPTSDLYTEDQFYRAMMPTWLTDGHEGLYALIKGAEVHGFYKTFDEAADDGHRKFPGQSVMARRIVEWHPTVRIHGKVYSWVA
jgi:hypothetical protein